MASETGETPSPLESPKDQELRAKGVKDPRKRSLLKLGFKSAATIGLGAVLFKGTSDVINWITSSESVKPTLTSEFDSIFKELSGNKFPVFENPNQTYNRSFYTEDGLLYEEYISGSGKRQLIIYGAKQWVYDISQNQVKKTVTTASRKPTGLEFDEKQSILTNQETIDLRQQLYKAFNERTAFEDLFE